NPPGVVCPDDVAVLTENPQNGRYPGYSTGWFGYGWNGYGFNASSQALISQLGYPGNLDGAALMERTDSQGFVDTSNKNNTIIGSAMEGGSSGGPWIVNLGIQPSDFPTSNAAQPNTVVGVTSWGFKDPSVQQQGASPFTKNNIVALVDSVCTATPG